MVFLSTLEKLQKILSIHPVRQQMATFIHQLQSVQQRVISAMEATVGREVSLMEGNHRRLEIEEDTSAREQAKKKKKNGKALVEQASAARQKQLARLCNVARYAEPWRVGHHLRSKPAKGRSLRSVTLCGEFQKPQDEEGGQVRQAKIKPNTVSGLVEELHIFHLGIDSGIDVRVPGTVHPAQKVWVNACANEAQNCRVAVKDAKVRCLEMRPLARGNWKIRMSHKQRGTTLSGSRCYLKKERGLLFVSQSMFHVARIRTFPRHPHTY